MDSVNNVESLDSDIFSLKNAIIFLVCLAVPVGVGLIAGYMTRNNMVVFDVINKPRLTPPAIVFPIAWSILYILMGIASFLAIINCKDGSQAAYILYPYIVQLVLNFLWSIVFFNGQLYTVAFTLLVLMWIMIVRTMTFFGTVSRASCWLMLPYVLWVTFAGYLNFQIVMLN